MKVILDIEACSQCPYQDWIANTSCSNSSGRAECRLTTRGVYGDSIPEWCPLREKELVEKKWNFQKE